MANTTLLMLKPGWPGPFRRTVQVGKNPKQLVFETGQSVSVADAVRQQLENDIGVAIFEVQPDGGGSLRFVEPESDEAIKATSGGKSDDKKTEVPKAE